MAGCIIAGLQPVTFVLCGESCFLVFFQNRYFGFAERYYWIQELFPRNLKVCKSCASRGHACPVHFQSSATFYLFFHPCAVTTPHSQLLQLSVYVYKNSQHLFRSHHLPVTTQAASYVPEGFGSRTWVAASSTPLFSSALHTDTHSL